MKTGLKGLCVFQGESIRRMARIQWASERYTCFDPPTGIIVAARVWGVS